jgi:hypothetical protein
MMMMMIIIMKFMITVCTRFSIYNKGPARLSYDNDGELFRVVWLLDTPFFALSLPHRLPALLSI